MVLGYTSIYTNLPVFSLMFDKDTDVSKVMKFPSMYKELQKGRELNTKSFLYWFFMSLFQASTIMLCSVYIFKDDKISLKISTVAFTCLIIAELLNVYSQINKIHIIMIISFIVTIIIYVCSLIFLKSILDMYYLSFKIIIKLLLITIISWIPFYIIEKVRKYCNPKVHEKLNSINT